MTGDQSLKSRTVLITRAAHQNQTLIRLVQDEGGVALELPMTEVDFFDTSPLRRRLVAALTWSDKVVLTSANSVLALGALYDGNPNLNGKDFYTVGPTSLATVRRMFPRVRVDCSPVVQGAEGLKSVLASIGVGQQRWLILRGQPTLNNIQPWLRAWGAQVQELVVYRSRARTSFPASALSGIDPSAIDFIQISSHGALRGLARATELCAGWSSLRERAVLSVISDRVARRAAELGWHRLCVSKTADDRGLVEAMAHYST